MRKSVARGSHKNTSKKETSGLSSRLSGSQSFPARLKIFSALFILLFFIAVARLVQIQIIMHPHYAQRAQASHLRERILLARRGTIFDRNNQALAINSTSQQIFIDPMEFKRSIKRLEQANKKSDDSQEIDQAKVNAQVADNIKQAARLLKLSESEIKAALKKKSQYVPLKVSLTEEKMEELRNLKFSWVGIQDKWERLYPYKTMAAQTLGFVGTDRKGLAGLEAARNKLLAGQDGCISEEVDARGNPIPNLRKTNIPRQDGKDITLTIDASLQQVAETALAKGIEEADAVRGIAIVMDPNNGDILALASQPAFDPNEFQKTPSQRWTNPAIVSPYEPGSTFKIVAASAILEEGVPESAISVNCTGEKTFGRHTIHCAMHNGKRAHGVIGLEKIIEESCNVGAASLAGRLGRQKMADYIKRFGFGERTGIELLAESPGQVTDCSKWSDIQLANIAFGQGISVTPLQLLRSYCIIANGGHMIKPHLIKPEDPEEMIGERVLSEETCATMRNMLVKVVESGTGTTAAITDYHIAGKTGTAQKAPYRSRKFIGSFIGFLPADDPKVAILVLMDEPKNSHYGGVVAAPVFHEIACKALLMLDVPPSKPDTSPQTAVAPDSPSEVSIN